MILLFLLAALQVFGKETVTCEIQGQLGNQMFQTAAAISFALDNGYVALFPSLRQAINGQLNLQDVFYQLDASEILDGGEWTNHSEAAYHSFAPIAFTQGKNLCLHGYFAHQKYFAHHGDFIRDLFAPRQEMLERIEAKYGVLLKGETVALHVRTFLPDAIDPNNGIGRTKWDYYLEALELFPEETAILVFTDSVEWVRNNFPLYRFNVHFIEGNSHTFDFYLMSRCSHQIISPKSTYSWWAAWLNPNPDKIVIRPDIQDWIDEDGFPSSWLKIAVE